MNNFKFITTAFIFFMLLNSSRSVSVDNVITMAIDELKPHHCVFWKLFLDSDKKTEYFINRQWESILATLLKKIPTIQIDLNNPRPFLHYTGNLLTSYSFNDEFYKYNINISSPMHIFCF